jgi:hypothetical protein
MKKASKLERKTVEVTLSEVPALIKATNGRMFSVTFIKKDSTTRCLTGRLGVTKCLKGGSDTTAHMSQYINVWDKDKANYRKVNLNTITNMVINHQEYVVIFDDRNYII